MLHVRLQLRLEMLHIVCLRFDRRVRRVVREVQEERLVTRVVDHLDRFVGQPIGQILARLTELQMRHIAEFRSEPPGASVRPPERLRRAPVRAANVHIKAMRFGIMIGVAKVPFADQRREIAGLLQMLRQRRFGVWQTVKRIGLKQFAVLGAPAANLRTRSSCALARRACR